MSARMGARTRVRHKAGGGFYWPFAKKNWRTFTNSDSAPRRLHDQQRDRRFRHSAKVTIALPFDSGARPKLPRSTGVKQKQHRQAWLRQQTQINTVRKGIGMHNFENQTAHQITNGS